MTCIGLRVANFNKEGVPSLKHRVTVHYDNGNNFVKPRLWMWAADGTTVEKKVEPSSRDEYGYVFEVLSNRSGFHFKFKDESGKKPVWESRDLDRYYHREMGPEIWTVSDLHNVYHVPPALLKGNVREYYHRVENLIYNRNFYVPDTDVSGLGTPSMLGANLLKDGSILFGLYHPRAARVYLAGTFNQWQSPVHPLPQEEMFVEMELYRGFYYQPNIWLARVTPPEPPGEVEYKFLIRGGTDQLDRMVTDPYTRVYGESYRERNARVVVPVNFQWSDHGWRPPLVKDLLLYELNVYGFTDNDPAIPEEEQGTFRGIIRRIKEGYFTELGVNALALMPTAEVPHKKGLGYEPCTYMSVEKDFGTPEEFRQMVDVAHNHGLAVIMDQVFNHNSNDFNPLWYLIDDGSDDGGLYYEGQSMWGNRIATGREEVDNMLIDSCKLFLKEYHVDGFRFDATHSFFLNHRLLHRLAHEIKDTGFKPDCILIAENLPNEADLNLDGFNGYAQWHDLFHDKIKALLREGEFEGVENSPEKMGSMFYFGKDDFAAHTNNVVNYCENHDENSVPYEVATGGDYLQDPQVKDRKARLGFFAAIMAVGQPMIYMGQEYGIERERNRIDVNWGRHSPQGEFYRWSRGVIRLRRRYDGLKVCGYHPIEEGTFTWVLGPWMDNEKGGSRRVIGWRTMDASEEYKRMLVMLNFEAEEVPVEVNFGTPGCWVKLADLEQVNDLPPEGNKDPADHDSVIFEEGNKSNHSHFVLPPYSGFLYRCLGSKGGEI